MATQTLLLPLLFLLTCACVTVDGRCNIMAATRCPKYVAIDGVKFHAFIPDAEYDNTCRNLGTAFECVYNDKYTDGCTINEMFFFDIQRDVYQKVCVGDEYKSHIGCLGDKDLESRVMTNCMLPMMKDNLPNCNKFQTARECAVNLVRTQCSESNASYMDLLAYSFLKPMAEKTRCTLEEPETPIENTTAVNQDSETSSLTTAKTTTTSKATTTEATSTTGTTRTTTASGSPHVTASCLLILFVLTVWSGVDC